MTSRLLIITLLAAPSFVACSDVSGGNKSNNPTGDIFSFTGNDSGASELPPLADCAPAQHAIIGSEGPACADPCGPQSECPEGLVCHTLMDANGDPARFCIEPHPTLCHPCKTDASCNPVTSGTQNMCIKKGDEGSFCGGACEANGVACPAGYSCQEIEGAVGAVTTQCVSDTGTCTCSPYAMAVGAETECASSNLFGQCLGSRVCTASGLSACGAAIPLAEVCNGIDENCDGVADEGVESPCGGCGDACTFAITTLEVDAIGTHEGPGGVPTNSEEIEDAHPFIWIANSNEDTVSRLNTQTGCEEARYGVCNDPSRTAVSLDGSGIVGCRQDGMVYKIAVSEGYCVDKNGNGTIETSTDTNEDCKITPDEMVSDDECIVWKVAPVPGQNGCARAAGVDADGNIWVGMWNTKQLIKLDSDTGETLLSHAITMRPYGLAIDPEGIIWVASRDPNGAVGMVHPVDGQLNSFSSPAGECYGLAIDPFQGVWVATGWNGGGLARLDTVTHTWEVIQNPGLGATRGVAVKVLVDEESGLVTGGRVYASHHGGGCNENQYVTVVDAVTRQILPSVSVGNGNGPVGVAIDSDGQLWTVNQCSNSATRFDTETNVALGTYPVGSGPYTYSDMTGYALKTITTVSGDYKHVLKGWESGETVWETLELDVEFPNDLTTLEISYRAANDSVALKNKDWTGPFGPFPPATFPLALNEQGTFLELKITLFSKSLTAFPLLKGLTVKAHKL